MRILPGLSPEWEWREMPCPECGAIEWLNFWHDTLITDCWQHSQRDYHYVPNDPSKIVERPA